jgi:membrane-associated phospholipid phosphatase
MTTAPTIPPEPRFLERLLARFDRVPGLGGGRTQIVFLALFFAVSFSFYLLVLKLRGPAAALKTRTGWDDVFPFVPWWTWVYMVPYLIGPLLVAVLNRTTFVWYVQRATVVVVISVLIFALIPTQTVRPLKDPVKGPEIAAELGDDLTANVYRKMVEIDDPPANAAPSLHVSLSCLLAWAITFNHPRWWWAALGGAVVVWLSTLFTAQHHLIDVATGAGLASLAAIGPPRYS